MMMLMVPPVSPRGFLKFSKGRKKVHILDEVGTCSKKREKTTKKHFKHLVKLKISDVIKTL